jgi:hypothetical protein
MPVATELPPAATPADIAALEKLIVNPVDPKNADQVSEQEQAR